MSLKKHIHDYVQFLGSSCTSASLPEQDWGSAGLMGFCILKGAETLPGLTLPVPGGSGVAGSLSIARRGPAGAQDTEAGGLCLPGISPISVLHETGKFIISPTGFASETQINFPSLPFSQASQSLNARES